MPTIGMHLNVPVFWIDRIPVLSSDKQILLPLCTCEGHELHCSILSALRILSGSFTVLSEHSVYRKSH